MIDKISCVGILPLFNSKDYITDGSLKNIPTLTGIKPPTLGLMFVRAKVLSLCTKGR